MPPVRNSCARARARVRACSFSFFCLVLSPLSLSLSLFRFFASPSHYTLHLPFASRPALVKPFMILRVIFFAIFQLMRDFPSRKARARAINDDRRSERASSRVEKRLVDISARRLSGMTARPALSPPAPLTLPCPRVPPSPAHSLPRCPYYRRTARLYGPVTLNARRLLFRIRFSELFLDLYNINYYILLICYIYIYIYIYATTEKLSFLNCSQKENGNIKKKRKTYFKQ